MTVNPAPPSPNDSWSTSLIDGGTAVVGQFASLDLFGDTPHIAYYDQGNRALKYAFLDPMTAGGWNIQTAVAPFLADMDIGTSAGIAIGQDGSGNRLAHLTGRRVRTLGDDSIFYWSLDSSGTLGTIEIDWDSTAASSAIDLSPDNRTSVIYKNTGVVATACPPDADPVTDGAQTDGHIYHKWYNADGSAGGCASVTSEVVAGPLSLKADAAGAAHAAYSYAGTGANAGKNFVRYRRSNTPAAGGAYGWTGAGTVSVAIRQFAGTEAAPLPPADQISLSLDVQGSGTSSIAHICAYDPRSKSLLYFRRGTGTLEERIDGTSSTTDSSDVGKFCDIAVDETRGLLHVSYYDAEHRTLKYARKPIGWQGGWRISTVDSVASGDVGQFSSIGADSLGLVHISYYDSGNTDLKYATNLRCGNLITETGEQCDDGNIAAGDGCSATCRNEAVCGNSACESGETTLSCPTDCPAPAVCGNGTCDAGEDNMNCAADCPAAGSCGNGICGTGETNLTCPGDCPQAPVCDNDNNCEAGENTQNCAQDCPAAPPPPPPPPPGTVCGNNTKETGEDCDDGNMNSGDGCSATCRNEGGGGGANAGAPGTGDGSLSETVPIVPPPTGRPTRVGGCSLIKGGL